MVYKVITAPTEEPVTLEEAKLHCRIDGTEYDQIIPGFIKAARSKAEHETGRAFCTQTRELVLDTFPDAFELHGSPISALVSLKYLDADGVEQTLDPADTLLDKDMEPGYLVPAYGKAWPASYPVPNAVRVRYTCGYGAASAVPEEVKTWIKLEVQYVLDEGANGTSGDRYFDSFLDPVRLYL